MARELQHLHPTLRISPQRGNYAQVVFLLAFLAATLLPIHEASAQFRFNGFGQNNNSRQPQRSAPQRNLPPNSARSSVQAPVPPQASVPPNPNASAEPNAIWVLEAARGGRPEGYFRKTLNLPAVEHAHIEIAASDLAEIFFNGRRIGTTTAPGQSEKIDLLPYVVPGQNILAIRATHRGQSTPYIRGGFYFKPTNQNWRIVATDSDWKGNGIATQNWQQLRFDDSSWRQSMPAGGRSGSSLTNGQPTLATAPRPTEPFSQNKSTIDREPMPGGGDALVSNPVQVDFGDYDSETELAPVDRFTTRPGFQVRELFTSDEMGSITALAFNEFGHIIAAQEGGPLLLIYDSDKDGSYDKVRTYCELVEHVQGILALNGDVYVTGVGNDGPGLYRLIDSDRNGELERSEMLVRFAGTPGEHGAHQIVFGPDGALYVVVGNHASLAGAWPESSTYPKPYEGDLVQPRFEDPGGHADGVKAPGGIILRYDVTDKSVDIVAGGLRNAYDIAFHPNGTMYTFDSDMEADIGAVWHRNTSLFQVIEGGEYGWRSGWANWPEYYLDRLPSLGTAGRASPTGMSFYGHNTYPVKYHRSLFVADWSEGRIFNVNVETVPGGQARMEEFVVGTPMNVTDLDIGPDGNVYFATGGRSTMGGIYVVEWDGESPSQQRELGSGITKAIRLPQLHSAFGRQTAALVKKEIGPDWDDQIVGVAYSADNPARYRIQALDLMQLLGPPPTTEMLVELSESGNDTLRAKCARMLGLHANKEAAERLVELTTDSSLTVRRAAMEAMLRIGVICDPEVLKQPLQSDSIEERFLARRLLALVPPENWKDTFVTSSSNRLAINSALVLVTLPQEGAKHVEMVLNNLQRVSDGFVSDADFVDLLRVTQVAFHLNKTSVTAKEAWKTFVANEFPAGNSTINGELIRLATYLNCDVVPAAIEFLQSDAPNADRMLVAMHLPMIKHEWTSRERMAILQYLENAQSSDGGGSYQLYVMRTAHAMSEHLTEEESLRILQMGADFPNAALASLFKLPESLDEEDIKGLVELDSTIDKGGLEEDVFKRLKTGITAILSAQESELAAEHLRQRWRQSPDRRAAIATAMAQRPLEDDWDYLVRSMGYLDLFAVADVCNALMKIDVATDDPEAIRQTIIQGCKLEEGGQSAKPVVELLEFWTGESFANASVVGQSSLAGWQEWFAKTYPDSPPAVLPKDTDRPRWSLEFLEQFMEGDQGRFGSREQGALLFTKAQCAACHKMNNIGNGFGPDLTSVAKRFTKTEFLESVLFPSHVISDQYASKKVQTVHGDSYVGIVVNGPGSITVRVSESKDVVIPLDEVEEILPSKVSTMPAGLFDDLTPAEIRDLLCFIGYVPQQNIAQDKAPIIRR